jgi:gas vesicle protein
LGNFDIDVLREREDHAATQGFLGGVLLGLLLGVVLTLVFAPRRGAETRAAVAETASAVRDKTVDIVSRTAHLAGHDEEEADRGASHEAAIEREIGGDAAI